jgi:hypothetical protein
VNANTNTISLVNYHAKGPNGSTDEQIHVATELDIKIYFDVRSAEFVARLGPVGDAANLHSTDFGALLTRIRERTLVVPVDAYTVEITTQRSQGKGDVVVVKGVKVVQYHQGRYAPYVIEDVKADGRVYLRAVRQVYLPTVEQIESLREVTQEINKERSRHEEMEGLLRTVQKTRMEALTPLKTVTMRSVQKNGVQVAVAGLGEDLPLEPTEDAVMNPKQIAAEDAQHEAFVNENLDRGVDVLD